MVSIYFYSFIYVYIKHCCDSGMDRVNGDHSDKKETIWLPNLYIKLIYLLFYICLNSI